ncbi:DegV family protein [Dehalobacter sp. DCM]|uniref:DegV family protein n=1 Tax=Dehalobacter sp. DCM TaxID=2907827 RepID=UPI003081DCCB|nr:DegV family protein [Dehalobacter sp. DCM]
MRKVKIITDSTNDLSDVILQKYDISVIPLHVDFGGESYRDGVDLLPKDLFKLVEEKNMLPKTAAPSPFNFSEVYREYVEQGQDIIVITISSHMSSTYQNAVLASEEYPEGRIFVVDSQNLSTGIGSLVVLAAEYALQGLEAKEIADRVQRLVPKVQVSFVIDTMEYLYKGGRCNVLQSIMGSMLKIRPMISVDSGKMFMKDKVRGDKKKGLDKMLANTAKDSIDSERIFITHSLGSEDEALYLKSILEMSFPEKEIITTDAGCVISSHCGQKTIGVIYIRQ